MNEKDKEDELLEELLDSEELDKALRLLTDLVKQIEEREEEEDE